MISNLAEVLEAKKMGRRIGKLSTTDQAKLEKMYTSGPAANGSAKNLQETSKMPKTKIDIFCIKKMPFQNTDKFNVSSLALRQ